MYRLKKQNPIKVLRCRTGKNLQCLSDSRGSSLSFNLPVSPSSFTKWWGLFGILNAFHPSLLAVGKVNNLFISCFGAWLRQMNVNMMKSTKRQAVNKEARSFQRTFKLFFSRAQAVCEMMETHTWLHGCRLSKMVWCLVFSHFYSSPLSSVTLHFCASSTSLITSFSSALYLFMHFTLFTPCCIFCPKHFFQNCFSITGRCPITEALMQFYYSS